MRLRNRRAARPSLERMEGRQLLSGLIAALSASSRPTVSAVSLLDQRALTGGNPTTNAGVSASNAGAAQAPSGGNNLNYRTGNGFTNNGQSPLIGSGTPTAHELAREAYRSGFSGRYYQGPGRFSDQGTTYYYRGLGGSNMFLHGDFNMAVVTPTDPSAPFFGEAVLQDKNNNSQAIQGFILTGNRSDVDRFGRPTRLTFTADPNIYSGVFFVQAAEGTVDIKYGAGPNSPIKVIFNGRVYTSGVTSPLVNMDLYARHGRPLRFHPNPIPVRS